jgi:hypothetical protein
MELRGCVKKLRRRWRLEGKMSFFSKPATRSLATFLRDETKKLEVLFGPDFRIEDDKRDPENACRLVSPSAEVEFSYDWRDRWVSASLRPLNSIQPIMNVHGTWQWQRFLGLPENSNRKSERDKQQMIDCLDKIEPILELFKDQQKTRDAYWFIQGYSRAYNDWASREGSWTEIQE